MANWFGIGRDVGAGVVAGGVDGAVNAYMPGKEIGEVAGAAILTAAAEYYLGAVIGPSAAGAIGGGVGTFVGGLIGEAVTGETIDYQGLANDAVAGAVGGFAGGLLGGAAVQAYGDLVLDTEIAAEALPAVIGSMFGSIVYGAAAGADAVGDAVNGAENWVSSEWQAATQGITDAVNGVENDVSGAWNWLTGNNGTTNSADGDSPSESIGGPGTLGYNSNPDAYGDSPSESIGGPGTLGYDSNPDAYGDSPSESIGGPGTLDNNPNAAAWGDSPSESIGGPGTLNYDSNPNGYGDSPSETNALQTGGPGAPSNSSQNTNGDDPNGPSYPNVPSDPTNPSDPGGDPAIPDDPDDFGTSYAPIVLNLNGGPVKLTQLSASNHFFDMAGDGYQHLTAWAASGNGVLFYDASGKGVLSQANQVVFTDWDPGAKNDMQALEDVFDTNHSGSLNAGDADFADFFLDVTNANGTTTVESLAQAGISAINLTPNAVNQALPDGSAIDGVTTYTTTSGGTGQAATVTLAADSNGYSLASATNANADGSTTVDNVTSYPQGGAAFERILDSSANGLIQTLTTLNSGGHVESIETDDTIVNANGSTTQTVTNYQYGTISATNRSGVLGASVSTTGALKLNSTVTTTQVSGGTTTATISRDQLGGGWTTQQEVDTTNAAGGSSIVISNLNFDGSTSLKTTETVSSNGYTRTTTSLVDGLTADSTTSTDATVWTTVGAVGTETVTDTAGTSTVSTSTTQISNHDDTRVASASLDGSGTIDLVSSTAATTNADGSTTILQTQAGRSGALMAAISTTTTANGLDVTTLSDLNGAGTSAAPVWDLTQTDDTTLYSSGPWAKSVALETLSGDDKLVSSSTTEYGADGVSKSVVGDNTGDGSDDYVETVTLTAGVTTDTVETFSGNAILLSETVRSTTADTADNGQTVTTSVDAAGAQLSNAPVFNLVTTDDTVKNSDGSSNETIATTNTEGTVLDRKQIVTSADGLTVTTDDDFTGLAAGSWNTKTVAATVVAANGSFTQTETTSDGYGNLLTTVVAQTSADRRTTTTTTTHGTTALRKTVETVQTQSNGALVDTRVTFDKDDDVLGATVTSVSADGLTKTTERDLRGGSASAYAASGLVFDFVDDDVTVINANGGRTTTGTLKSNNGALLSTSTSTVSANGLTTTTISNPFALADYASKSVDATTYNADGGETVTGSVFDYADDLVDRTISTASGNGLSLTTTYDLNGDGVVDRATTSVTTINANGSRTQVVTDFTGAVTTGTVRDATTTTTGIVVAGAGDETTIARQVNGSVSYYQTETITPSASGSDDDVVSTYASNGGALLFKTQTTTSHSQIYGTDYVEGELVATHYTQVDGGTAWDFWTTSTTTYNEDGSTTVADDEYNQSGLIAGSVVTTSANGLSKTVSYDRTGDGQDDFVVTDNIVLNSDGSRTETVIDSSEDGSPSSSTATTTSADGAHTTIVRSFEGDGGQNETIVRQANGSIVDTAIDANNKGATVGAKVTTTSGNGLSATTQYYTGGSPTTGALADTQSSTETINADGSEQVAFSDTEASGASASTETTTSGNGDAMSISSNLAEAFGVLLAVAELTTIPTTGGSVFTIGDTLTPSGTVLSTGFMPVPGVAPINYTYKDSSTATTNADGLLKTYSLTDAGYGGVNLTSNIATATDGSVTETFVAQNPSVTGQTDTVTDSADGRTLQLQSNRPESGGLQFLEKVVLNADGTVSVTSSDNNSVSAFAFSQTRSDVLLANGGLTATIVDPGDTTTQTISPNGLSITTTTSFASGGALSRTDVTAINGDGSRTQTVTETASGGATLANLSTAYERVTTTSADGRQSNTQVYGNGGSVLSESDATTVASDGGVVQTSAYFNAATGIPVVIDAADGSTSNVVTTTTSADGLVQTTVAGDLTSTTTMLAGTNGSYDWSEVNSAGAVVAAASHVVDANDVDTWTSTSGGTIEIDAASEAIAIGEAAGLYYTILGRSLTFQEQENLNQYIQNGVLNQSALAMALLISAEFTSETSGASNSAIATRLYENAFGVAPTSAQLTALNTEIAAGATATAGLATAATTISELADAELTGSGLLQSLANSASTTPSSIAGIASPLQDLLAAGSAYEQGLGETLSSLPASASALASAAPINIYSGLTGGPPTSATRIVAGVAVQSGANAAGWYEIGPFGTTTPSYWYLDKVQAQQTVNFTLGTGAGVPIVIAPLENQTVNFDDFYNSFSGPDKGVTIVYGGAGYDTFDFNQLGAASGEPSSADPASGVGNIYIVDIPNVASVDDLSNLNVAALESQLGITSGVVIVNPTSSDVLQLDGATIGKSSYGALGSSGWGATGTSSDDGLYLQQSGQTASYGFVGSDYLAYFSSPTANDPWEINYDTGADDVVGILYNNHLRSTSAFVPTTPALSAAPNADGLYVGVNVNPLTASHWNYFSYHQFDGQTDQYDILVQQSSSGIASVDVASAGVNLVGFDNGVFGVTLQGNGPGSTESGVDYYEGTTTYFYGSQPPEVPVDVTGNQNVINFVNPGLPTNGDFPTVKFVYSPQQKLTPGQKVEFATVTAAKSGDVLTITQGPASGDGALSLTSGILYYTAPSSGSNYLPVTFTLGDQNGNVGSYGYDVMLDSGPVAHSAQLSVAPSAVLNLTALLSSLSTPGLSGDTDKISAATSTNGVTSGSSSSSFTYTAPATGTDRISYTVTNQLGQAASGVVTVSLAASGGAPAIAIVYTSGTPINAGAGYVLIGTATAANADDVLTASLSSGAGTITAAATASPGVEDIFYTPPASIAANTANQIVFTATDTTSGATANASLSIPLTIGDPGPTAASGTLTIGHGQTQTITSLLMGLVTPGLTGDTETLTAVTATAGTATLSGGVATYVAPASGTATITYTVKDQLGETASSTVAVTVDPGPTAKAGTLTVGHGQTQTITSVLTGLVTPGLAGDTETLTAVTATAGTATLSGGVATYVAPASGTATISYTVKDQLGETATGTVAVTVDAGPTITAKTVASIGHGQSATISTVVAGISGDTLTLKQTGGAGTLSLSSGTVTFTAPATGGSDALTYTITDQHGDVANGSATIPVDPGPTAKAGTLAIGHGQTQTITSLLTGLVTPGLTGDTETLTAVTATAGTATLSGGVATYVAPASGTATISYTVKDQLGETASSTVAVTVDPGPTAKAGTLAIGHGQTQTITSLLTGLVTPGLTGDTETLTAVTATAGTATLSGGVATYVAPASGTATISYTVKDQLGETASSTVAVTVDPGPTAKAGTLAIGHGQTQTITSLLTGLVTPGLTGDTETLTAVTATAGTATLSGGVATYVAPASGTATITYTVKDQLGETASSTVAVTVDPGPTAKAGTLTVGHGQTQTITSVLTGLVTPGLAGDTETLTAVTATAGTATLSGGVATYVAPASGTATISYTVKDQLGETASGTVAVTVDAGPTITAKTVASIGHGQSATISTVVAGISGDTLTLKQTGGAGTLALSSGTVTFTAPATGGSDALTYTITDQHGDVANGSATIPVDPGPTAKAGTLAIGHGQTQTITSLLTGLVTPGLTGDTETLTAVTATAGTATLSGGVATYVAPASGTATISYTVKDQLGETASSTVAVTVDPGPTAKAGTLAIGHGQTQTITSLLTGLVTPGLTGDTETLTAVTATAGTATLSGGVATYVAPASGTATISYTVKDQLGETASSTVAVTVDPGPTAKAGTLAIGHGQTQTITSVLTGLVTPGLAGDTETLTAVTATAGTATLSGGVGTYVAPASGTATISYTVKDQLGETASSTVAVKVDPGPTANAGAFTIAHNQNWNITSFLQSLVTPGVAGDTETITAVSATAGTTVLSGGGVAYAAPSSGTATISYTVKDQLGDTATGSVAVTVDPGPTITAKAPASVGHGQTATIATVAPGLSGDTLTLSQTGGAGTLSLSSGTVSFTAPATGGSDALTYTITDQYGDVANGSATISVDPGPTANAGAFTIAHNQNWNITSFLQGLVTPGLTGDTETITAVSATAGTTVLSGGGVAYAAPSSGTATISYTVKDQFGETATGSATATVDTGPTLKNQAPALIAAGKATVVGAATPGLTGDTLTLVTNATGDAAPAHGSLSLSNGQVDYTSSGTVAAGGVSDSFTYQVEDQYGDISAQVSASVLLDGGPTAGNGTLSVGQTQSGLNETAYIQSLFHGGVASDATAISSVTGATLSSGQVLYTPPASGNANIGYTVTDSLGQTASGIVTVTVHP